MSEANKDVDTLDQYNIEETLCYLSKSGKLFRKKEEAITASFIESFRDIFAGVLSMPLNPQNVFNMPRLQHMYNTLTDLGFKRSEPPSSKQSQESA